MLRALLCLDAILQHRLTRIYWQTENEVEKQLWVPLKVEPKINI